MYVTWTFFYFKESNDQCSVYVVLEPSHDKIFGPFVMGKQLDDSLYI